MKKLGQNCVPETLEGVGNLDFLLTRPKLLAKINLRHDSGTAQSLIETQVRVLRDKNLKLESQMLKLVNCARDNGNINKHIHKFILRLLELESVDAIISAIKEYFLDELGVDLCRVLSVADLNGEFVKFLVDKLGANRVFQGRIDFYSRHHLFGSDAQEIKSAACVYLKLEGVDGVLVLGSRAIDRYQENSGTWFLEQLGGIISRLLDKYDEPLQTDD